MTNKVLYEKDGRIGRITLNRPDVLNAIDDELPGALAEAVARAEADPGIHVWCSPGMEQVFVQATILTITQAQVTKTKLCRTCPGIRSRITPSCGAIPSILCRFGAP